jgi:hypothetical protein
MRCDVGANNRRYISFLHGDCFNPCESSFPSQGLHFSLSHESYVTVVDNTGAEHHYFSGGGESDGAVNDLSTSSTPSGKFGPNGSIS